MELDGLVLPKSKLLRLFRFTISMVIATGSRITCWSCAIVHSPVEVIISVLGESTGIVVMDDTGVHET